MKKLKKSHQIELFISDGEFDTEDIGCVKQLLNDAGAKLDHAYATDITGCPIFKAADGKWYTGSVEFTVYPANLENVVEILLDNKAECDNCGHIEPIDDLNEMADLEERLDDNSTHMPDGDCTKCGAFSYQITKAHAQEIAGITKKKRQRRRGGLK